MSFSIPGIRISQQADGTRHLTLSVPGTGLRYTKKLGAGKPNE